jgi:Ca2+-binding EF-hand superfamily protein
MKTRRFLILCCLLPSLNLWAQDAAAPPPSAEDAAPPAAETSAKGAETGVVIPDYCDGVVDPYNLARERRRFFYAAGKDTELTQAEFEENRNEEKPFVRSFDKWAVLLTFDTDRNGTIDWLEADTYRRDIRKRLMDRWDVNRNGRLQGEERDRVNAQLHAGRLPTAQRKQRGMGGIFMAEGSDDPDIALLQKYDANGDGVLTEDELDAAMSTERQEWRQEAILRYDTNGDGQLDDAERKAMYDDRVEPWQQMRHRLQLKLFDENGDGEISAEEQAAEKEFNKTFKQVGESIRRRMQDIDGDGEISDDEKQIAAREMQVFGLRMMVRMRGWMDADADGAVSQEEMRQFQGNMAQGTTRWFESFADPYDLSGDGRFDQRERDELAKAFSAEIENRLDEQDSNQDGRIDGVELEKVIVTWGREAEVFPDAPETAATSEP